VGLGFGVNVGSEVLTNLRFADDVLLFAQCKADIGKMIGHLQEIAARYGLRLNYSKTKVFTTTEGELPDHIMVGTSSIEVLQHSQSEKYLGRKVSVDEYHWTEIRNRAAAGWRTFMKYKAELCNKNTYFRDRARLFESVVTPTVLYGTAAWTLTGRMETFLRTTRRKMLRMMFGARRRRLEQPQEEDETTQSDTSCSDAGSDDAPDQNLEPWPDFIQRVTADIEERLEAIRLEDWVITHRRRKWIFAGRTARCADGRWSKKLLNWQPQFCFGRRAGHPCRRWDDDIQALAGGNWCQHALDESLWQALGEAFVHPEEIEESFTIHRPLQ